MNGRRRPCPVRLTVSVYCLFNDALISTGRVVNDEFDRVWKESVVAYFNESSRNLLGAAEVNHENSQSLSKFERNTSRKSYSIVVSSVQ
jgi:hypothetical protein